MQPSDRPKRDRSPPPHIYGPPIPEAFQSWSTPAAGMTADSEDCTTLMGIAGCGPDTAQRLLLKHGSVEKAVNAFYDGDTGENAPLTVRLNAPSTRSQDTPRGGESSYFNNQSKSPIDLTVDDDEQMAQAIKASLEGTNLDGTSSELVPSQRAPDPNWAMVPSNVEVSKNNAEAFSQDDQTLSRAIEASLNTSYGDFAADEYEVPPLEKQVRIGKRPVALRPAVPTMTYAALILQGLFFVPQFRQRLADWHPYVPEGRDETPVPTSGDEHLLWLLVEVCTTMDMGLLSELNVDSHLLAFDTRPWGSAIERVGDLSSAFFQKVALIAEELFKRQWEDSGLDPRHRPRIFQFSHSTMESDPVTRAPLYRETDNCIVKVDLGVDPPLASLLEEGAPDTHAPLELLSVLSTQLSKPLYTDAPLNVDQMPPQDVICAPSETVAFHLVQSSARARPVRYGKSIYLDPFLRENAILSRERRWLQRKMQLEISSLRTRREALVRFKGKDVLKDLRASIHYYAEVADAKGDPVRQATIERTRAKLQAILEKIEAQTKDIDAQISQLQIDAAAVMDIPELQRLRYDLRVVFVHDGLFGRKHLYSYVQDQGKWWKTVDSLVDEVSEETVLNDQSGIHLGAGPYLLLYSRALPDADGPPPRLPWPEGLKQGIKRNNLTFMSQLPPEVAENMSPMSSPPTSPIELEPPSDVLMGSDSM
ncbi:hypothetical protein PLICRDRAFT_174928 [Plicaturopsis crispa FD-325 SS-3]|nr:hypothetical protein PLICRDRAFT_174928 [Plicaturopsis crispa FD-325 SS-3]